MQNYLQMFGQLGSQDYESEGTAAGLEKFVRSLYGEKRLSSVNRIQKNHILVKLLEGQ